MPRPMTMAQALRRAQSKYGKAAAVRDNGRRRGSSSPEQRAAASTMLHRLRENKPTMKPLAEWPADATVGEYRTALAAHNEAHRTWRDRESRLMSDATYHRYEVMKDMGFAYQITGSGDTWEEALTKAGIVPHPNRVAETSDV